MDICYHQKFEIFFINILRNIKIYIYIFNNMTTFTKEEKNYLKTDPITYANSLSGKQLEILVDKLNIVYRKNNAQVPDSIYDLIQNILKQKKPNSKVLNQIGVTISDNPVKLKYKMPSINKVKKINELEKWLNKYNGPHTISDKLDGVSAMIQEENGNVEMYLRGDGDKGREISELIEYIIPKNIIDDIKKNAKGWAIRGELIISKNDFKPLSKEYSNARNLVSGLVNSKKLKKKNIKIAKVTQFIPYAIINPEYKIEVQMSELGKRKFKEVVYNETVNDINIDWLAEKLGERRKKSKFEIDGIIIHDNSKVYEYNNKNKNPKHAVAYKNINTENIKETTVIKVHWALSKAGYYKPRIEIDPVIIDNKKITFVTGNNAGYINKHKIGPGKEVSVILSGEVIPKIHEIKKNNNIIAQMPNEKYKWNTNKTDIKTINLDNNDIKIKKFVHFFKTLNIKGFGEGVLTKLVENGFDSYEKILTSDHESMTEIYGIGKELLNNLDKNTEKALGDTSLEVFMHASNIFGEGLGHRKLKLIIKEIPDIINKKFDKKKLFDEIMNIDGFSDITTNKFIDNLNEFKTFFSMINKIYNISHLKNKNKNKNKYKKKSLFNNGFKVVFTGFRDKNLETIIIKNGGDVVNSISNDTNVVICNDTNKKSSKLDKAKKKGIAIIKKDDFIKKYKLKI